MNARPTCGAGLADRSALHLAVAEVMEAIAENLEAHIPSLPMNDPLAEPERDAYLLLEGEHRRLVEALRMVGSRMAGYRELPMPEHDPEALTGPAVVGAFRRYLAAQERLLEVVRRTTEADRALLAAAGS
jgi:hypothetical protein